MKSLILALQFLTRVPLPAIAASREDFARSIRWFPAAGLAVGLCVAGAGRLGQWIDPWLGALLALLGWVWITGALHLDGLADLADARGAAHGDRDRLLAVLRDPHVGSFGVVAIGVQLAAKLVLLRLALESGAIPLLLIPIAARMGPLFWARMLPPLHAGLGSQFSRIVRPIDLTMWTAALLALSVLVPALLLTPVLMAAWSIWLLRHMGGISGDGHGAGIELIESGLLLAMVIAGRF